MTQNRNSVDISIDPRTRIPYGVSRHFASLADVQDPTRDPIAAQYLPQHAEQFVSEGETPDPIADAQFTVVPRLIHHYHDRALLLVNDRCATYCRYCFRRHFTGHGAGHVSEHELNAVLEYLNAHEEVSEVLLSGGDPLMLSDEDLLAIIDRLRSVRPFLMRLCTRMPVVLPSRVTASFARQFGERSPGWVVVHANHPKEITAEFERAVGRFLRAGVPVANQSVLLRGINDDASTLETLFRRLQRAGVRPYYLFQGDLASGTAHFRVPISRGIELMRTLRSRLSGLALPTYAVDLPGGGGKVPVESSLVRTEESAYILRDSAGREWSYPREDGPTG